MDFRNYGEATGRVENTYRLMHENQTMASALSKIGEHCRFDKAKLTIWEAIEELNNYVDESDPDLDLPQIVHALQTAEKARELYPTLDWLHLVALIHDLGKIIGLPKYGGLPQWSVVGDTFPVGCAFSEKIVFADSFKGNPDTKNSLYNSKFGIYKPNCGLDNVTFSFGHDEYLYQVLIHNRCTIPHIGMKIIRYHSFYAWHKEHEYEHLMCPDDYNVREWCEEFSKIDLYTKDNDNKIDPATPSIKEYYQGLIKKYFPEERLDF